MMCGAFMSALDGLGGLMAVEDRCLRLRIALSF